jgi:hypothetical protein
MGGHGLLGTNDSYPCLLIKLSGERLPAALGFGGYAEEHYPGFGFVYCSNQLVNTDVF